jgi:hypothetical protein
MFYGFKQQKGAQRRKPCFALKTVAGEWSFYLVTTGRRVHSDGCGQGEAANMPNWISVLV